jgi:predicted transcriptional regulator
MGEALTKDSLYGFTFRDTDNRRVPDADRKTYDIKQLWQRSHEIVNLAARGFKQVEIAEILNITPQTVSNTLNSELGKVKLSELRLGRDDEVKKTVEKVRVLTSKALETYHKIFDDESGESSLRDKKNVADTVLLELSGLRAPTKIQSQHTSFTLSAAELEEFKQRGIAAARESGLIVDINPEPIVEPPDDRTVAEAAGNQS